METSSFRAMNTDILLVAEGETANLHEGFRQTEQLIRSSEARFSRFREDSELMALNRSAGTWFQVSPDMFDVLSKAERFFHQTRGLFDPSILPDLLRVGYDRSMDLIRESGGVLSGSAFPAAAVLTSKTGYSEQPFPELMLVGGRPSFSEMELDDDRGRVYLPSGMSLDLGGIAKGWIAEQAALLLSRFALACTVNAGGDMFLIGLPVGQEAWPVALENPLHPEAILTSLDVEPGALVTSAVTKRTWNRDGKMYHHLIDPRTGESANSDWLSVTVMAAHASEAEVFAKALLLAGPDESEEIARNSGAQLSYLAVDRELKIWGTPKSLEYVHVNTTTD